MNDREIRRERGKVVILLGPPGSGKGTQAVQLSSALGIPAISTGEMLRQECRSHSQLGETVQNVIASGGLVSDELMNSVVKRRLGERDCRQGCILDGYPRTSAQAAFLDRLLARSGCRKPVVVDLAISADEVIGRLSHRRQCGTCGRTYQVDGPGEAVCEADGGLLIRRADDGPAAITERLRIYERKTREVVEYYRGADYHQVTAARPVSEISSELLRIIGWRWPIPVDGASTAASYTSYPA